jgi:hypothetical protein
VVGVSSGLWFFAHKYLKELYGPGVRRIDVFSAPPLGCLPAMRTLIGGFKKGCVDDGL